MVLYISLCRVKNGLDLQMIEELTRILYIIQLRKIYQQLTQLLMMAIPTQVEMCQRMVLLHMRLVQLLPF